MRNVSFIKSLPGTRTKRKRGSTLNRMEIVHRLRDVRYRRLLRRATLLNKDFGLVMTQYDAEGTFMFLDPPYVDTVDYDGVDPFTEASHRRLALLFKGMKRAKCLMVVQKHELMSELYRGFVKYEYDVAYGSGEGRVATHLVITNYPV